MKKTVAVFFGGRSTEHDISIITALSAVIKPLELSEKFNVVPVYITKDGRWFSDEKLKNVEIYRTGQIDSFCEKNRPLLMTFDNGLVLKQQGITGKAIKVDVAFPAMHGPYGEDGSLMGLLRMAGVPYVGCDLQSSVVAMDKILTKIVVAKDGIKVVPDVTFMAEEYKLKGKGIVKEIESKLGYPAFVKPPHLGSSIGVTKVNNRDELTNAIEVSLHYDSSVLVEMAVQNLREATLPIIGFGDNIIPSMLEEPIYKADDYFDFETKYINQGGKKGGKKGNRRYSKIPADLPKKLYEEAMNVAIAGYKSVGCSGIARVDILINEKTGDVYLNEINPMPGDLYIHNWRASSMSSIDLVCKLVDFAEEKFKKDNEIETVFKSNFLKQF